MLLHEPFFCQLTLRFVVTHLSGVKARGVNCPRQKGGSEELQKTVLKKNVEYGVVLCFALCFVTSNLFEVINIVTRRGQPLFMLEKITL